MEIYCHHCKHKVEAIAWTSQPIWVCPDCGNVLRQAQSEQELNDYYEATKQGGVDK